MSFFLKDREDGRRLSELVLQSIQDTVSEFSEVEGRSDGSLAEDVAWNHGGPKHQRALVRLRFALQKAGPKWKAIDDALPSDEFGCSEKEAVEGPIAILVVTLIDLGVDALEQQHRRRKREILASGSRPK